MFEEQIFPHLSPVEPDEAQDTETDAPEEADEATTDTAKEEEAKDTETEEKAEGEDKPQLIFGKYKTLEEAEKAFKSLERSFGKKSSEAARMRKELEQLRTPAKDEKEPDPLEDVLKDPDKWMERLYKEGPKAVLEIVEKAVERRTKPLEEKVATTSYQEQVRQFREEHDDLDEYAEDMAEWLRANPEVAKERHALETAYKVVKFDRLMETLPRITEQGSQDKAKASLDKQAARMPSGGRQTAKEPSPEEALAASLLAEDKKARGIFG